MSQQFKDHEEFFECVGDSKLAPTLFGDRIYAFTVEEMYQHFRARYLAEQQEAEEPIAKSNDKAQNTMKQ